MNSHRFKRNIITIHLVFLAGLISGCYGTSNTKSDTSQSMPNHQNATQQTASSDTAPFDNGRMCIDHLVNAKLNHFNDDWSLPENIVDLRSEEGQVRLLECSYCEDYPELATAYLTQATQTFCGLASTTMVLNADAESRKWRPVTQPYQPFNFYTQCNLLNDEVREHIDVAKVLNEGMELNEIFFVVKNQPSVVDAYCQHATSAQNEGELPASDAPHNCGVDQDYNTFMKTITNALNTPRHYVIANFAGAPSPERGGHFSPIAAYHKASDSFLIMDVARYKYPPFWISSKELWQAMQKIDSGSGKARGYIIAKTKSSSAN
ncbi:phytochelatin synthase family protein [Saccharophagus degradans]|uniref:phytochelatin synthase family protein n=1 Tax=Saccharophagus degradans TaxID=86304 RepID=UPI002477DA05|nr:phytochelatin synthase family protein [Saccharophagus degradans]WGO98055.1 phytochelatin synthase family protein [Saccharophagus degradans]